MDSHGPQDRQGAEDEYTRRMSLAITLVVGITVGLGISALMRGVSTRR